MAMIRNRLGFRVVFFYKGFFWDVYFWTGSILECLIPAVGFFLGQLLPGRFFVRAFLGGVI